MMKQILIILMLVGFQAQSHAQISYTPVFIDGCTHEVVHPEVWLFIDGSGPHTRKKNSGKTIKLPGAGAYQLILAGVTSEIVVNIGTDPVQNDTLLLPRLKKSFLVSDSPITVYTDCGNTAAEGSITDYYLDSTIRMVGTFKDGRAIDTVWNYYPNGNTQRIEIHTSEGYYFATKTYYESGTIESASDFSEEVFKEYYENGALKLDERFNKREQFDSLGYRTDFIKRHKVLFTSFGIFPGTYKTKWIAFDITGKKTRRINQKSFGYSAINKSTKEIHHSEFEKAIFWENGKKYMKIYQLYDDTGVHFIVSKHIGRKWLEVSRVKKDELHETIEAITNGKEY